MPRALTRQFFYILGVIYGDGNLTKKEIRIFNNSYTFLEEVANTFKLIFGICPTVRMRLQRGRIHYVFRAYSTKLAQTISSRFNFPRNKRNIELPRSLTMASPLNKRYFIAGLFDTDGTIIIRKRGKYIKPYIGLEAKSTVFIKQVKTMLQSLGFDFTGPYIQKTCWNIRLEKNKQFNRFVETIPMKHPKINKIRTPSNSNLWPG